MKDLLIRNARIVNEGEQYNGSVLVKSGRIAWIEKGDVIPDTADVYEIDATGLLLLPGVIDEHVHFREPGLTHKADIATESAAAVAGGVTSVMEMPNTKPQAVTCDALEEKHELAASKSLVNYSFYLGATNENLPEVRQLDPARNCGVKVFMGASTGNMLVDERKSLEAVFAECPVPITTHSEDEATIKKNTAEFLARYGEDMDVKFHPMIRSEEACYKSSSLAVELAGKYGTRLHLLHLSTARELELFDPAPHSAKKRITAEACIHHLWFDDSDYERMGTHIKWNPAVKTARDREGLLKGLLEGRIDAVATDHAPHTLAEKGNPYFNAPSGGPMVQHSLAAMLELSRNGKIPLETVVSKMCHAPADIFNISERGYIRDGYHADLVLVSPDDPWTVNRGNIRYKCGWSPMEGVTFHARVACTLVNGRIVYENFIGDPAGGTIYTEHKGKRLAFNR